jgi:hypothetical protein
MEIPAQYLERLQAVKRPQKITSERQDLIQRFTDKINSERVGTKWKPVIWRQINGLVAHIKIADLYWFYKRCGEGDSFSKKFFGILKSMRVAPPPVKKKWKKK